MKGLIEVVRANRRWENAFALLLVGLAALACFFGALTALKWAGLLSTEVASWVQAIGSIGAILGAVWISNKQHRQDLNREERRDRADVAGLIRSLQTELDVAQENFEREYGSDLTSMGKRFSGIIAVAAVPFQIYSANTARIGKIPSDEVRKLFVRTYGLASSFVLSLETNNGFERQLSELALHEKAHEIDFFANRLVEGQKAVAYADSVRKLYKSLLDSKGELFEAIKVAQFHGELDR